MSNSGHRCTVAALIVLALGTPALAANPPTIGRADAAAVRYDEPTGRFCIVVDTVARSRPPRPECATPAGGQTIGIGITRQ